MESIVPGLEGRKASGGVYASLSRGVYSLLEGCTVYWLWGGVQLIEGCTFVESWWTNTVACTRASEAPSRRLWGASWATWSLLRGSFEA